MPVQALNDNEWDYNSNEFSCPPNFPSNQKLEKAV